MVGAVVVREGALVGVGHHERFGGPHAEVQALAAAGEAARGATLFVTLEPCCHQGKTPPCTVAVIAAGVRRVVAAMEDPFPKVHGGGLAQLRAAGLEVEVGVERSAARALNSPYLKLLRTGRPYVVAKWAMTLDGKTACATGDSRWISGPRSRALVHELRGRVDAVLVGIGTALADDPLLTARPPGPRTPARLVLDSAGRLPLSSKLVRTAHEVPVVVAVTGQASDERLAALEAAGCEVLRFAGQAMVPIGLLLEEMGRRRWTNVLVEGGSQVLGELLDAGEIDRVEAFIAPILEGGSHGFQPFRGTGLSQMASALRLEDREVVQVDGDVLVRGTLRRPWFEEPI